MSDVTSGPAGRLLLVEDDEATQVLIKAIFAPHGMVVECAGDGDAALRQLRRGRFDAVILDLMVPGPNGFEILREMKSRERALLDRTIVLTGAADAMLRDFSDGSLVRRVMRKPFELEELVAEVLSLTRVAVAQRSGASAEQYLH